MLEGVLLRILEFIDTDFKKSKFYYSYFWRVQTNFFLIKFMLNIREKTNFFGSIVIRVTFPRFIFLNIFTHKKYFDMTST